jgi:hypothetical protein
LQPLLHYIAAATGALVSVIALDEDFIVVQTATKFDYHNIVFISF